MDCNCCEKLQDLKDKIADLELEIHRSQEDFYSSLYLVARIREALGDNGLRMQDELIEYCKTLKQRSDSISPHRASMASIGNDRAFANFRSDAPFVIGEARDKENMDKAMKNLEYLSRRLGVEKDKGV
jgi:hypothetical protein